MFTKKVSSRRSHGFTLVEILIALFIFAIISVMLTNSLHTVIDAYQHTEEKGNRLIDLRFALLIMSRDFTSALYRPILNNAGNEEPAVYGDQHRVSLTHIGMGNINRRGSNLERSEYFFAKNALWRKTYAVLDRAPDTLAHERMLIDGLEEVRFEYLDSDGKQHNEWLSKTNYPLPKAINVTFSYLNGEKFSEFYLLSAGDLSINNPGQVKDEGS